MQTNERNYGYKAEDLTFELERADKFIQLLFEELDDAYKAILDGNSVTAAYWLSTRHDVMEAELTAAWERVSAVRATLQEWVDEYFGKDDEKG